MVKKIMQSITKLINTKNDLERGTIIKCKGKYPYEAFVDFMVTELPIDEKRRYALLVVSGYKAGLIFAVLPEESVPKENEGYAISSNWLKDNWEKWGYFDCPLQDVYLLPPPDSTAI
jgi:Immunity protein 45